MGESKLEGISSFGNKREDLRKKPEKPRPLLEIRTGELTTVKREGGGVLPTNTDLERAKV